MTRAAPVGSGLGQPCSALASVYPSFNSPQFLLMLFLGSPLSAFNCLSDLNRLLNKLLEKQKTSVDRSGVEGAGLELRCLLLSTPHMGIALMTAAFACGSSSANSVVDSSMLWEGVREGGGAVCGVRASSLSRIILVTKILRKLGPCTMMVVRVEVLPMFSTSVTFNLLISSSEVGTDNAARMPVGMVRRNRESFDGFAEPCEVPVSLGPNGENQVFRFLSIFL